jgi:uncharacterized protein (DUF433 family)
VLEASRYLWVPERTLQGWVHGYSFSRGEGRQRKQAVVPADPETGLLSFADLAELHVLAALRREHGVPLRSIRHARDFMQQQFGVDHPLTAEEMETDGKGVFVRKLGRLLEASRDGQLVLEDVIAARLKRIERDTNGLVSRLYPYTRKTVLDRPVAPTLVTIDAQRAFGRPVITGTRFPTEELAGKFFAGDSFERLVDEYGCRPEEISEAIRYEWWRAA